MIFQTQFKSQGKGLMWYCADEFHTNQFSSFFAHTLWRLCVGIPTH